MNKKIVLGTIFVIFLLLITPNMKAIECSNSNQNVKEELYQTISKLNVDEKLKKNVLQKLNEIEDIDRINLNLFKKFNSLSKVQIYNGYNYFLTLAIIHVLWSLYYMIEGDTASAKLQLQLAILDLIMFVLVNS
jgi:long-subunit acyl-CoA synthetase (AMP-forming)